MATRMCLTVAAAFVFCTSLAQAGPVFDEDPYIVVDLVPDNPGPYYGGEEVGVDVWLRAENTDEDLWLRLVRFAFGDSDPSLTLDPTFTFDFSSLMSTTNYYEIQPLLPRPYIDIFIFPEGWSQFLHLQGHEGFHIGNINVILPEEEGRYTLDLLTPQVQAEFDPGIKAYMWGVVRTDFYETSGNLQGGTFDFVVVPEPGSLTLILAALIGLSHKRRVRRKSSHHRSGTPGRAALSMGSWGSDMATRMCLTVAAGLVFCTSLAQAGPVFDEDPYIVVEVVPDNPGPYYGGENVNVDVNLWLNTQTVDMDLWLGRVSFDFSGSDPLLTLDPTFSFDFSTLVSSYNHYQIYPLLPRPLYETFLFSENPTQFLHLRGNSAFHVGNIGVNLPQEEGTYTLDLLTPQAPSGFNPGIRASMLGIITIGFDETTGNLQGGTFDFEVIPEPASLTLILAALFGLAHKRRVRRTSFRGRGGSSGRAALLAAFVCLVIHGPIPAWAETQGTQTQVVPMNIDSGVVSATGTGGDPVVVFSEIVSIDGALWIRLHYESAMPSGSESAGNPSFLRLSSLTGGTTQVLHADGLGAWANGSAAFKGHAVLSSQLDLGAATWQRACF